MTPAEKIKQLAEEYAAEETWPLYSSTPVEKVINRFKQEAYEAGARAMAELLAVREGEEEDFPVMPGKVVGTLRGTFEMLEPTGESSYDSLRMLREKIRKALAETESK
jgi:hypothetical protein